MRNSDPDDDRKVTVKPLKDNKDKILVVDDEKMIRWSLAKRCGVGATSPFRLKLRVLA